MNITVSVKKSVEVMYLAVEAKVRYWEDAEVNGVEDTDGNLIPFKKGELWRPKIILESGLILGWPKGTVADIHYKVCDAGTYYLLDGESDIVTKIEGYVPKIMCPAENGYGDYIIMKVNAEGIIENWKVDLRDFEDEEN